MSCRTAKSLSTLRAEIRAQFPNRDEASDGGCASPDHSAQNPGSDHEPNAAGVARAYDYDEDLNGPGLGGENHMLVIANHIRKLGEDGDARLVGGTRNGYVIYEQRIAGAGKGWLWRPYSGYNAHKHHMHVSVCSNPAGYDDATTSWGIKELFAQPPTPIPDPPEEDDMGYLVTNEDNGFVFSIAGNTRRRVSGPGKDPARVQELKNLGWVMKGKVSTGHLVETTVPADPDPNQDL